MISRPSRNSMPPRRAGERLTDPLLPNLSGLPSSRDSHVHQRIQLQGIEDFDSGGRTSTCMGVKYYDKHVLNYNSRRLRFRTLAQS